METVKHSYACSILKEKRAVIFRDGKQILNQEYPFKYPPLKTYLQIGYNYSQEFTEQQITKIKDYTLLNKLGWKISSVEATGLFFSYQRKKYFLSPLSSIQPDYGGFPLNHTVLVDYKNQLVKLTGANVSLTGDSGWLPLYPIAKERTKEKPNPFQIDKIENDGETYMKKTLPSWATPIHQSRLLVPEEVVGITEKGEICCLDRAGKAPRFSIAGMSGKGKSLLKNNLQGQLYHKGNCNLFEINDVKYDSQTYCLPWRPGHPFYREIQRFNEPTIPLPYVYLHPTMKNLLEENILYKDEVGFEISFPFKDFLLDTNLMKYNKQWKTSDSSRKYIRDLIEDNQGNTRIDGLLYKRDLNEIKILIHESLPDDMTTLRTSIFNLIKDVWSRKILDINTDIKSKWVSKQGNREFAYPPWDTCLLFGLIPSFITAYARTHDWFDVWMKYILEDVF